MPTRAAACVFTRQAYVWDGLDRRRVALIPPCIDPLSLKNIDIPPDRCAAIMHSTGLEDGARHRDAVFERGDGRPDRVVRKADMLELAPVPTGATDRHAGVAMGSIEGSRRRAAGLRR